jgi:hypothetical protein
MSSWAFQPLLPATAQLSGGRTGYIKVWDGNGWVKKPVKYWTGSEWVQKPLKYWTGSEWVLAP